ncbi:MAG: energy transducer TonB [Proteobacteria bacterium]|nr:energy transducer TonB [Pseudomonadota bacterium]
MVRLTVGKLFSSSHNRSLVLDDHQRFAKMLIFAALIHLVLFISFDINYQTPLKAVMNTLVEVNLIPVEEKITEYVPPNPEEAASTQSQKGISFIAKTPTTLSKDSDAPRRRTISAASHEKRDASYLTRWQSYVENFGNSHYPEIALKNKLRGDLRLLVALNKDGSIKEVSVRQSSGIAQLDQAAIKLVYQAAPFEPLPEEMTTDTEILEIIRTWQFRGELTTS